MFLGGLESELLSEFAESFAVVVRVLLGDLLGQLSVGLEFLFEVAHNKYIGRAGRNFSRLVRKVDDCRAQRTRIRHWRSQRV